MTDTNHDERWILRKAGADRDWFASSYDKLKAWALEGRIDPDDQVGPESAGDDGLRAARELPDLRAFLAPGEVRSTVVASGGGEGGGFGPRREGSAESDEVILELTPLIDVVFLLLIFFMLTATFSHQGGLKVKLPESGAASSEVDDKRLTVTVTDRGEYFMNEERTPVAREALRPRLEREVAASLRTTLIIRADETVPHGDVVFVMNAAELSGVEKILVGTEKKRPR